MQYLAVWLSSFSLASVDVVIGLLIGLVTLTTIIGKLIWTGTGLIRSQLESTKDNTKAVRGLSIALMNLEETTQDRIFDLERKIQKLDEEGSRGLQKHLEALATATHDIQTKIDESVGNGTE